MSRQDQLITMTTDIRPESSAHDEKIVHDHDEHATGHPAESFAAETDADDTKITWLQVAVVLVSSEFFHSSVSSTNQVHSPFYLLI